ncbi:hypothetical protein D3C85_1773180 [compost metagenome]
MAMTMLNMNMKASSLPMSAWNLSSENDQVATPMARVMAVKMVATPTSSSACSTALVIGWPLAWCSCRRL